MFYTKNMSELWWLKVKLRKNISSYFIVVSAKTCTDVYTDTYEPNKFFNMYQNSWWCNM